MIYSPIVRRSIALLALLSSCSYSLDADRQALRAEIVALERKIPADAPLWVHDGPDNFNQWIEDDSPRVPDFIYLHLLRKLHGMSSAELERLARGPLDWDALDNDPDQARGRVFRAHGVIGDLHGETVDDARHPVRTVHAGIFFDRGRRPVIFHVVDKPDVLVLREDTVETTAVFVKMIEYTSASGRQVRAPLLVGKSLRRTL